MITIVGLTAIDFGAEMFANGWCLRETQYGPLMLQLGLQFMLMGMVALV